MPILSVTRISISEEVVLFVHSDSLPVLEPYEVMYSSKYVKVTKQWNVQHQYDEVRIDVLDDK